MSNIYGNPKMSNTSISKNLSGNTLTAFKGCITNDICALPENGDLIYPVSGISISTTLTAKSSGHIINVTTNNAVITLPPATDSTGVYFIFILPEGTTSIKWIVSPGTLDTINGPINSGGDMVKINKEVVVAMGTVHGRTADGSTGDKIVFKCNGTEWFILGISQLDAFGNPPFSLTISSNIDTNGTDQHNVLNNKQNVHIFTEDVGGWNWNNTEACSLLGFKPENLNFIQFGLEQNDPVIPQPNTNDGLTWNSHVPAFIDTAAPGYSATSVVRAIDLHPFDFIIKNNLANSLPVVSFPQIKSYNLESITIYFKTGDGTNGGNRPDMNTGLKWGRLTEAENLWIEFCDSDNVSLKTPTSRDYGKGNSTHSSYLQSLYSAKEELQYTMVEYEDLLNSPLYLFAREQNTISQIPVSRYWHAGTTSVMSLLSTSSGWNVVPTTGQGGDGIHTAYDLTYGSQVGTTASANFIYTGTNPNLSGIYGAARNNTALWDPTISLVAQTLSTRNNNVNLVNASSPGYPGYPIPTDIKHGNVSRDINIPDPNWIKVTINKIPKNTACVRIFQDRYTGGGNPPNDNYAIASVKVTFSGTYNSS